MTNETLAQAEKDALWEAIESAFLDTTTWDREAEDRIDRTVERILGARLQTLAQARTQPGPMPDPVDLYLSNLERTNPSPEVQAVIDQIRAENAIPPGGRP